MKEQLTAWNLNAVWEKFTEGQSSGSSIEGRDWFIQILLHLFQKTNEMKMESFIII